MSKEGLRPYPQDMKDQIHVDVFVRIWGTHYQIRRKKWQKLSEQAFIEKTEQYTNTAALGLQDEDLERLFPASWKNSSIPYEVI